MLRAELMAQSSRLGGAGQSCSQNGGFECPRMWALHPGLGQGTTYEELLCLAMEFTRSHHGLQVDMPSGLHAFPCPWFWVLEQHAVLYTSILLQASTHGADLQAFTHRLATAVTIRVCCQAIGAATLNSQGQQVAAAQCDKLFGQVQAIMTLPVLL